MLRLDRKVNLVKSGMLVMVWVMLAGVGIATLAGARDVSADAAPIKIVLAYVPDLSNWGPSNATGIAEIVLQEGEVDVSVVGLPATAGETYNAWIVNTQNSASYNVGYFDTDKSGVAKFHNVLPAEIPSTGWNLFMLTVESKTSSATTPGDRRSIAGYFPMGSELKRLPVLLPKTGGDIEPSSGSNLGPHPVFKPTTAKSGIRENLTTYGVALGMALVLGIVVRAKARRG